MAEFKKGDRVRRTSAHPTFGIESEDFLSRIGTVIEQPGEPYAMQPLWVTWGFGPVWYPLDTDWIELLSPEPAPGLVTATSEWVKPAGIQNYARALDVQQQIQQARCSDMMMQQRPQHWTQTLPPADDRGLRSELADAKADRDHWRNRAGEAEVRVAWLERENVRLGGKKRGAR